MRTVLRILPKYRLEMLFTRCLITKIINHANYTFHDSPSLYLLTYYTLLQERKLSLIRLNA